MVWWPMVGAYYALLFFFSSRRRHTRLVSDWSSDVCSSDLDTGAVRGGEPAPGRDERVHDLAPRALRRGEPGCEGTAADVLHRERSEERRVGKEGRYRGAPGA